MTEPRSPRQALISGALWTVASRWSVRGLGFVSTVVMARLLMPEDYGLVALAMLVVGAMQAFMDVGAATALLRKNAVSDEEVNSAWTLRLLQSAATAAMLLAVAPLAIRFFTEPRLLILLWVFSAAVLVQGLTNIGPILAIKAYDFSVDFRITVLAKVASVVVTLLAGWWLRDYRALVLGLLSGQLIGVALSYAMHPWRPRWCTKHMADIWHLTKWLMLANMGSFVLRRGDEFVAGAVANTRDYGLYNVGADLGAMPVAEVGPAMLRALLPVLASIQHDAARLRSGILRTLAVLNSLVWPIAGVMAALSSELTLLILGPKWTEAAFYVAAFAIISATQVTGSPVRSLLTVDGETRAQSRYVWSEFAVFAVAASVGVPLLGLTGLVLARFIGSLFNAAQLLMAGGRRLETGSLPLLTVVSRPVAGAIVLYAAVRQGIAPFDSLPGRVFLGLLVGAVAYIGWSAITWRMCGRPDGAEALVVERWVQLRNRRRPAP